MSIDGVYIRIPESEICISWGQIWPEKIELAKCWSPLKWMLNKILTNTTTYFKFKVFFILWLCSRFFRGHKATDSSFCIEILKTKPIIKFFKFKVVKIPRVIVLPTEWISWFYWNRNTNGLEFLYIQSQKVYLLIFL